VKDLGVDTYFDAANKVGKEISLASSNNNNSNDRGILVCGTGMGVGIMANKHPNVRAATVENVTATRFARAVNDANVLCLGQLVTTDKSQAFEMLEAFLSQEFNVRPNLKNGEPAPWWNEDVEKFLSTSKQGIERVEREVIESNNNDERRK